MKFEVLKNQRYLYFENGNYVNTLLPGSYHKPLFKKHAYIACSIHKNFPYTNAELSVFLEDESLAAELKILEVLDHQIGVHAIDGRFENVYTSGKYAFWEVGQTHTFQLIDMKQVRADDSFDISLIAQPTVKKYLVQVSVEAHEQALVFYDGVFQQLQEAGKTYYWTKYATVSAIKVDLRLKQLEISGQEMLSADKVPLRMNFVCQYQIADVLHVALKVKDLEQQLHVMLQLILREYVGMQKLDELLVMKQDMADFVLKRLKEKEATLGITFLSAGVKDIILPGDIKGILNMVLIAQKQAQANVITRQEEVASTRSLLNTAKLMEENPILMKLKELEYIEKICDKVGSISVSNGGNIMDKLGELIR